MSIITLPRPSAATPPRRIAIISDAEPCRNGVGAYYSDLSEQLVARNFVVQLFGPRDESGRVAPAMALPLPGDSSQRLYVPNPFELNARLGDFAPDLVILPTPGVYGLTGAFLSARRRLPVLVGFHTSFEHLARLYWQQSVMARVVRQYFRNSHAYLFNHSHVVVANTRDMCRLARRLGAPSAEIVGTLLPPDFMLAPPSPHSGRLQRVLFAGRLATEKNIESVIRAASLLPGLQFSIAGDGPLRSRVVQAATELTNLHYLGWLSRSDLRQALDDHDLLLLPSHFESFGNIALEAMARQRPAVVTSRCGIAKWPELAVGLEVIDDGNDLPAALARLAALSPEQLQAMGQNARAAATQLNDRTLDHWCQLLGDSTQRRRGSF